MFVLKQFKMAANQIGYSRLERRSVTIFLVAEPCEMYKRRCDVFGDASFSKKNACEWAKYVLV